MATDKITLKKIQFVDEIKPGYFILIETPDGTRLIDYKNFVVSTDNITFDPLLSAFDSDIKGLSAQVIAQDAVNVSTFQLVSAQTLSLFSSLSAQVALINQSLTADEATLTSLGNTVGVHTTTIATLSTTVDNHTALIAADEVDINQLLASLAQIAALSGNWNSVYTTVHINSAGSSWHN